MSASGGTTTPISDATARVTEVARHLAEEADELYARISGRQHTLTSWFLVFLCWVSLALNVWLLLFEPHTRSWHDGLRDADWGVSGFLALSICWRWLRFRIGRRYLREHWWEVPALVPVAVPHATEWHWVMWLVLAARVVRVVDRTDNYFGDKIVEALIKHFADPIVDVIKRPITIAVMDEVIAVIQEGTYAANVRAALDENHTELEAMVHDLVMKDPTTSKLRLLPFHDDLVKLVADTVLRIVDGALDDPRTTELISDVIRNSATQLRHAIRTHA
jgi:hypothetical protein